MKALALGQSLLLSQTPAALNWLGTKTPRAANGHISGKYQHKAESSVLPNAYDRCNLSCIISDLSCPWVTSPLNPECWPHLTRAPWEPKSGLTGPATKGDGTNPWSGGSCSSLRAYLPLVFILTSSSRLDNHFQTRGSKIRATSNLPSSNLEVEKGLTSCPDKSKNGQPWRRHSII